MGETASKDEAAANGDIVHLLGEAATGVPGTQARLAEHLRRELGSALSHRLAGPAEAVLADAGALVLQQWRQLAPAGEPAALAGGASAAGKKGKPARKTAGKARKGAKAAQGTEGVQARLPADHDAGVPPNPLWAPFVEQGSRVMLSLVHELAARSDPDGRAARALEALSALEQLDPPIARVARLRWFGGLDEGGIARLLGADESEVRRGWLKARAFVAAATHEPGTASP